MKTRGLDKNRLTHALRRSADWERLSTRQEAVLAFLLEAADPILFQASVGYREIGSAVGVSATRARAIVCALEDKELLRLIVKGGAGATNVYEVLP